jgi:protein TonB
MKHEKLLRLLLFAAVAAIHILLILFLAINTRAPNDQDEMERARVMKLVDVDELPPPPPPPEEELLPQVEAIAEIMIETDEAPLQTVVAPGTLTAPAVEENFLPQHLISVPPVFNEREIAAALIYPPIAQRAGIEGRVILELFVDRTGLVRQVVILQETPPDRGFGEAAVRAFTGLRGTPALANGEPVSCRFRYPVRFVLR